MEILKVTLSPEAFAAKQEFMHKHDPVIPSNYLSTWKNKQTAHAAVIQTYLNDVYKIKTTAKFRKDLVSGHFRNHPSANFTMPFAIVDAIVMSCEMWRKYVATNEDFVDLVTSQLIAYATIHCSVITPRSFPKKALRTLPPAGFETVVSQRGHLRVLP